MKTDLNFKRMSKEGVNIQKKFYLKTQKRVKDIRGFYAHFIATFFIIPFFIFINLELVPQFHWFWFAIGAWLIGVFIHWFVVFVLAKGSAIKQWEENKMNEFMNEDNDGLTDCDELDYTQETHYLNAKRRIKDIRGFYIHLMVNVFSLALIIYVNLEFVPGFYFFKYVLIGMVLSLFFHWGGVFGLTKFGFGKDWEKKKLVELIEEYKNKKDK